MWILIFLLMLYHFISFRVAFFPIMTHGMRHIDTWDAVLELKTREMRHDTICFIIIIALPQIFFCNNDYFAYDEFEIIYNHFMTIFDMHFACAILSSALWLIFWEIIFILHIIYENFSSLCQWCSFIVSFDHYLLFCVTKLKGKSPGKADRDLFTDGFGV